MLKNLFRNEYVKNISTVAGGVFLSQLITVGFSPILTRLYSPESFGVIASFLAIVNILTVVSTFRYENVLILIQKDRTAKNLMVMTSILVLVTAIIFFVFTGLLSKNIGSLFFSPDYENWVYWIPLMIIPNGFFYLFRNWLIRKKDYFIISSAGISKSLALNFVLICGVIFFSASAGNFLIANILAQFIETGFLFLKIYNKEGKKFNGFNFREGLVTLKEHINFPKFTLPADLINALAVQNPILVLSVFFGATPVGIFSVTERVLGVPVKLISNSTLEVYKQKAAEQFLTTGNCKEIFLQTFKYLALVAILPTAILVFFSPWLFEFVFGEDWKQAGLFAQFLSIKFFFQLSVRPLGFTLLIAGKQLLYLYWQIGLVVFTTLGLFIGVYLESPNASVLLYSIAYSVMYIIYFFISYISSLSKAVKI